MAESKVEDIASLLQRAIVMKYGKRISAGKLSRDLHMWSEGNFYVSAESIRKWRIGRTKPRYEAVSVLESFFKIRLVTDSRYVVKPRRAIPPPPSPKKNIQSNLEGGLALENQP